jgi:hypothetical protein
LPPNPEFETDAVQRCALHDAAHRDCSEGFAVRLLIAATIILVTIACSGAEEFDRRVSSSDEIYVSDLARELDAAGVDFRALRDGSIAYRSRDEQKIRSIEERLTKEAAARASAKK